MQFASIYQAGTWPHSEESASRVCIQHLLCGGGLTLCGGGFNPHQPPPEYATAINDDSLDRAMSTSDDHLSLNL